MKAKVGIALVWVCFSVVHAETGAPVAGVDSRIAAVTVYADRARVQRTATVQLPAGVATFAFAKLPGWTDEGSVRLSLAPAAAARIADVRVAREYLARSDDATLREAQAAVQELTDKIAELDDELGVLAARQQHVESIRAFSLEKLPRDAALRAIEPKAYGEVVDFVSDGLREVAKGRREIQRLKRELEPERHARSRRLDEIRRRTQLEQCTVLVSLRSPAPSEAELTLTYMLPGATWEPAHELRAQGSDPRDVSVMSYAVVTQTTGEDWEDAAITFSTQSPTEPVRIPELDALLVGGGRALAQVQSGLTESFQLAQSKYEGQNTFWFSYRNPDQDMRDFVTNVGNQKQVQGRTARTFRKLQRRGTTAHFPSSARPTVRSDGRSIRVPIGDVELAATVRVVAAPAISLNAARTVELVNTGGQPLLPGRTALYADGAFLGMTDVDFVAAGESFAVFLGVADRIKLTRTLDHRRSSVVHGRRTRMQIAFEVGVENLADEAAALRLVDRVPVSENREVEVLRVRIAPDGKPDAKGMVTWDLTLGPKEKRVFGVEYTIEYPGDFVARAKAQRAPAQEDEQLTQQIEELEFMMR